MLKLSKKTEYGLQLMVYLARYFKKDPVSLKIIAKKKNLPYRFLSQVATKLKKANLLKTKEGTNGGYYLAQDPQKIIVADILETLEGPIELVECLKKDNACPWAGMCTQKQMFEKIEGSLKKIIDAHTLADLINYKSKLKN